MIFDIARAFPEDTIPKFQPDTTGFIEGRVLQPISVIYHRINTDKTVTNMSTVPYLNDSSLTLHQG